MIKKHIDIGLDLCSKILGVDGSAVIPSLVVRIYKDIGSCETCKWCHSTEHSYKRANGETMHYVEHNCEVRGLDNPSCSRVELTDYCSDYERKEQNEK